MKWRIISATAGEVERSGEPHHRQEILRVEVDFDGPELARLRPFGPELPMGRLYLELDLNGPGPHQLFRQALGNKSGLTQTLYGSLVVRVSGAKRR